MYFHDRGEAGDLLANQLESYRYQDSIVLAVSAGGVLVGERIARKLNCPLALLTISKITALGEPSLVLGTVDQDGDFTYNDMIPSGEMEEYLADMWVYLEEEKLRRLYDMTCVMGVAGETVDRHQFANRNVIITTDGVSTGLSFKAALHYLHLAHAAKTIAAIPLGPAPTIERINELVDEMHYLYIPDNFYKVKHYYEDNKKINPELVLASINQMASRWK